MLGGPSPAYTSAGNARYASSCRRGWRKAAARNQLVDAARPPRRWLERPAVPRPRRAAWAPAWPPVLVRSKYIARSHPAVLPPKEEAARAGRRRCRDLVITRVGGVVDLQCRTVQGQADEQPATAAIGVDFRFQCGIGGRGRFAPDRAGGGRRANAKREFPYQPVHAFLVLKTRIRSVAWMPTCHPKLPPVMVMNVGACQPLCSSPTTTTPRP